MPATIQDRHRKIETGHGTATFAINRRPAAMYMAGCGADQNPEPRRTVESAVKHGEALARAVSGVLEGNLEPVQKPPVTAFTTVDLEFPAFDPERFRKELEDSLSSP